MRVQGLTIALRARSSWEAVDLGIALVRQHARPIYLSWFLATGIAFLVLNALLVPFGLAWLASLLLWWLKPVFDRIPLHVLSRAILDQTPNVRETLRAQRSGASALVPWLLWRRLHPSRSMLLSADLLEGERGARRTERVRVLGAGDGSTPVLLWVIGAHLELVLWGSIIVFGLMLVPTEFLSDSAEAVYEALIEAPPWWMEVLNNGLYWLAMSVIEPLYVGAGFALYLNRRTQLEAWDIELAFRRLAARLGQAVLIVVLACPMSIASACTASLMADGHCPLPSDDDGARSGFELPDSDAKTESRAVTPLSELFETPPGEGAEAFARAVEQALADPDLSPKQTVGEWRWRDSEAQQAPNAQPPWLTAVSRLIAFAIENMLWILLGIGSIVVLLNHRRWLPWLLARDAQPPASISSAIEVHASSQPLPADLTAAVLSLWQSGDTRAALSLFYRGALAALVERLGNPLPPGATEADCLRLAQRVPSTGFATAFRRIVGCWQAVAYAHRAPDDSELRELIAAWRAAERPA